jgi:hypothetical protein
MRLDAGTLTTSNNVAGPPPPNGSYNTIITDDFGNLVSTQVLPFPSRNPSGCSSPAGLAFYS